MVGVLSKVLMLEIQLQVDTIQARYRPFHFDCLTHARHKLDRNISSPRGGDDILFDHPEKAEAARRQAQRPAAASRRLSSLIAQ